MLKQAPAEKLSLGIPFYCWQWQNGVRAGATTYKLAEKNYRKGKNKNRTFDSLLGNASLDIFISLLKWIGLGVYISMMIIVLWI
jgi:hypothetical protein